MSVRVFLTCEHCGSLYVLPATYAVKEASGERVIVTAARDCPYCDWRKEPWPTSQQEN